MDFFLLFARWKVAICSQHTTPQTEEPTGNYFPAPLPSSKPLPQIDRISIPLRTAQHWMQESCLPSKTSTNWGSKSVEHWCTSCEQKSGRSRSGGSFFSLRWLAPNPARKCLSQPHKGLRIGGFYMFPPECPMVCLYLSEIYLPVFFWEHYDNIFTCDELIDVEVPMQCNDAFHVRYLTSRCCIA